MPVAYELIKAHGALGLYAGGHQEAWQRPHPDILIEANDVALRHWTGQLKPSASIHLLAQKTKKLLRPRRPSAEASAKTAA